LVTVEHFFAKSLDYEIRNTSLLHEALTHRSASAINNERLEFLGDGVLNFSIASEIFDRCPDYTEGQLSRLRASLVRGTTLAEIAREIDLGGYLKLGSGELKSGGFKRESILADTVEALIGAVYLDGGFEQAHHVIRFLYRKRLDNLPADEPLKDPKTRLQEYLQGRRMQVPEYSLVKSEGDAHKQVFTVSCKIDQLGLERITTGSSRRRAEQAAAQAALESINAENEKKTAETPSQS